ncbi:MAG: hypothetical protein V4673_02510 [Pseudomonadota bacterium]
MRRLPVRSLFALCCAATILAGCRRDPSAIDAKPPTGEFGQPGSGFVAQCSGWFPDWISANPPPAGTAAFQLAQGYPLGVPVFADVDGRTEVVRWDPFAPTNGPWSAHDFRVPAQRGAYLNALRDYLLAGMVEVDFVAQRNRTRRWYHVPMMTSDPISRREPYRGLTKERPLNANDHDWIVPGNTLQSFAIGYYNNIGGYTIGKVFGDPDPSLSDPAQAQFIDGALVFKLLFAEFDPAKIVAAQYPLDGAPQWQVQDPQAPAAALKNVRLIQIDVAVKDPRATQTGWVFATFVYDESLTATEPVAWRRLAPVGLQWGNDPDVTANGVGTLDETWIAPGLPAAFHNQLGRHGRRNGPVDNPLSSCLSCHSTAQVSPGATPLRAFRGVRLIPPAGCSDAQDMAWFRNLPGSQTFGLMGPGGDGCALNPAQPAALVSTDYSLQLADALEASLFFDNPNPCMATAMAMRKAAQAKRAAPAAAEEDTARGAEPVEREIAPVSGRVKLDPKSMRALRTRGKDATEGGADAHRR